MKIWDSPLGSFEIEVSEAGVSHVQMPSGASNSEPVDAALGESLTEHLYGRPASLKLDLQSVTSPIAQLTLAKLLEIPYGEVRSYAWVAKEIGHPAAVRPVANAVAGNPIPLLIPCHRVVRSDGHSGNYSLGGPEMKQRLLAFEGLDLGRTEGLATRGVRFIADKETNTYHLPTCRLVPLPGTATEQELHQIDDAIDGHLDPCRRCRPI